MKILPTLILIFFGIALSSCSKTDNASIGQEEEQQEITPQEDQGSSTKHYKKTTIVEDGEVSITNEVFYNTNSTIESIVYIEENFVEKIYTVNYLENDPVSIKIASDFSSPYAEDDILFYNDIIRDGDKITLVSEESDRTLEIYQTNNFVDATNSIITSTEETVFQQTFTRNTSNQLISNTSGIFTFSYSNFDENKEIDPTNGAMEYEYHTLFMILGLKITMNNPSTSIYQSSTANFIFEYDSDGYVIKSSREGDATSDYATHEYVER